MPHGSSSLLAPSRLDPRYGEAERYRALFDLAPHAQVWTDETGRILRANHLASALLAEPPEKLTARPLAEFVSPPSRRRFRLRLARLRKKAPPPALEEWEMGVQPGRGDAFEAVVAVVSVAQAAPPAVSFLWSLRDVTASRRIERRSRDRERDLRRLSRELLVERDRLRSLAACYLQAREAEARRIALQLHDEAAQMTTFAQLAMDQAAGALPPSLAPCLLPVRDHLRALEDRLRRISHELRPTLLDHLGLGAALGFLAESFTARTHVAVDLGGELGDAALDPLVEVSAYRIIQEALANVARHAAARRVWIRLQRTRAWLLCSIRDDGVGFDPQAAADRRNAGLGLLGIRERLEAIGGHLSITTARGRGTELVARIPLQRR